MAIQSAFVPYTNTYALALTTSSANVQIVLPPGQVPQTIRIVNNGAVGVQVIWGYSAAAPTAVAATVGTPTAGEVVNGPSERVFTIGGTPSPSQSFWLAGVTLSGSATIYFSLGDGR